MGYMIVYRPPYVELVEKSSSSCLYFQCETFGFLGRAVLFECFIISAKDMTSRKLDKVVIEKVVYCFTVETKGYVTPLLRSDDWWSFPFVCGEALQTSKLSCVVIPLGCDGDLQCAECRLMLQGSGDYLQRQGGQHEEGRSLNRLCKRQGRVFRRI